MFSDTSRVMFIKSPALASDEFKLLLYRVRFVTLGAFLSIVTSREFRFAWVTVRLFPANASVTVDASHADGQVEFSITALDLAGNSLTVTQANLNSLDVTIDKNAPSVTNLTLYSNNSNSSLARAGDLINITLEASEQIYNATLQILGTEIDMTESNNTAYTTISVLQNSPNGLATFNITAYDGAGNEFNVTQDDVSANVIIDTANPTLSNLTIYSNNAHNTSLATLDDKSETSTITTSLARSGDLINITLEVSENIYNATLQILILKRMNESNNTAYKQSLFYKTHQTDLQHSTLQHMMVLAINLT